MADESKQTEPPDLTILALGWAAYKDSGFSDHQRDLYCEARRPFKDGMTTLNGRYDSASPLVVARGVAELFAYRLSKHASVRVAPVRLSEREPDTFENFTKEVTGGWVISERVPQALPCYYLRDETETIPRDLFPPQNETEFYNYWRTFLDKRCPIDRTAYADFPALAPNEALTAARWNSPERLLGHAFRAFLHASHAHTSNVLVDVAGRLWLIDNEAIVYREDTRDIETLHALVERSPSVMKACRQISSITPHDISAALYNIPWAFWGRDNPSVGLGPRLRYKWEGGAFDYFNERLKAWQKYFPAIEGGQDGRE